MFGDMASIFFSNEPGLGARIDIDIPFISDLKTDAEQTNHLLLRGDHMNLLVVDDEYYIVQGIISSIRCDVLGIDSIFAAYSCEQARQIIAKKQVDILITDPLKCPVKTVFLLSTGFRNGITLLSL